MRVCQPGPVAFQVDRTDSGRRMVTCSRGLSETGRPARLTTPRLSIASVSRGRSRYSEGLITCASTRLRSLFEERGDASFFAAIGFSHAKYMADRSAGRIADHQQATFQKPEADHARLAVVPARVLDLEGVALEHDRGVFEIQAA